MKYFLIGLLLFTIRNIVSNGVNYFHNDVLATNIFFYLDAVAIIFVSFQFRKKHWFINTVFWLAIYNLIDQIRGYGSVFQWYEYPIGIGTIFTNWILSKYFKTKSIF